MSLTLYTGDNCPYCPQVKKYLAMKKAEYKEINVDHDAEFTRGWLQEKTGQSRVPVLMNSKNDVMIGYNLSRAAEVLSNDE